MEKGCSIPISILHLEKGAGVVVAPFFLLKNRVRMLLSKGEILANDDN